MRVRYTDVCISLPQKINYQRIGMDINECDISSSYKLLK